MNQTLFFIKVQNIQVRALFNRIDKVRVLSLFLGQN